MELCQIQLSVVLVLKLDNLWLQGGFTPDLLCIYTCALRSVSGGVP